MSMQQKFSKCFNCNQPYDLKFKSASVIACGHTFCQQCLLNFVPMQCPIDKQKFQTFSKNEEFMEMLQFQTKNTNIQRNLLNETIYSTDVQTIFKISFLGDASVGKSSIIKRLVKNEYHPYLTSTIGIDFQFRTDQIQQASYKFQFWDTAGQQEFRAITKIHYKNSHLIMMIYAVNQPNSFQNICNYWIGQAKDQSPNAIFVLIGNKIDEKDIVEKSKVKLLINKYQLIYFNISCKTNQNIQQLWKTITELLVNNYKKQKQIQDKKNDKKSNWLHNKHKNKLSLELEEVEEETSKKKSICC